MTKQHVLVVGSSNTDMILKMDRIPKPGETIIGGEFMTAAGGKGANQAVAAARAGADVSFIARVGRDMFGEKAIVGFTADGINVDHVMQDDSSPSGVALIFVGSNGQNSIGVASGANAKLTPADLRLAKTAFRRGATLLLQLETPLETVGAAAEMADAAGMRVILNPAPARQLSDDLLQRLYLLTPNESETELLTGIPVTDRPSALKAASALLARGVRNVIVTMGEHGALISGKDGEGFVEPFHVKAVDTTAAGDVFNGALAVALAEGLTLVDAARFASAAAAISVTRMGAQTSAPSRFEITEFLTKRDREMAPTEKSSVSI